MNANITRLHEISKKNTRHIIGLMSGTSMDGLDLAYCEITGFGVDTNVNIIHFDTIPYPKEVKNKILDVFAKETVSFPYMTLLNAWIGTYHGELINTFIKKFNISNHNVDCIASHGQTVMHTPKHQHKFENFGNATLQIGDGDHIAVKTGLITLSDFRQKHVAAGGEGAPLAVYGDYLIFSKKGEDRIMLNMGGISNFTYLPASGDPTEVFVTDTGPGNTIMDQYMRKHFGKDFDKDAQIAKQGQVDTQFLEGLMNHYFLALPFPKTTGPEIFNLQMVEEALRTLKHKSLSHENILATLNYYSAKTISQAILNVIGSKNYTVYTSGGGAHNPLLMQHLQTMLPTCAFKQSDILGILGDAKEAVLFAVLANETLAGQPIDFGSRQKIPSVCMGKISFPT